MVGRASALGILEHKEETDMGNVIAVCTSPAKGTQKTNVGTAQFQEDWGIVGDAHAGKWHRQVSLLSWDKIEAFRSRGAEVRDGDFGENLVVSGIDFRALPIGTVQRRGAGADPNRQGVSPRLPDFSEDGGVHYAP